MELVLRRQWHSRCQLKIDLFDGDARTPKFNEFCTDVRVRLINKSSLRWGWIIWKGTHTQKQKVAASAAVAAACRSRRGPKAYNSIFNKKIKEEEKKKRNNNETTFSMDLIKTEINVYVIRLACLIWICFVRSLAKV